MGLLLLSPKGTNGRKKVSKTSYVSATRHKNLQIQGIIVRMKSCVNAGFLYCRSTPNMQEIQVINKKFAWCHLIMGDFNLSPKIPDDKGKLERLCGSSKFCVLKEITRVISDNQLDHILADKAFEDKCFATSYFNFISDHKSIVVRVAVNSEFTDEILEKISFESELHMKKKRETKDKTATNIQEKIVSPKSLQDTNETEAGISKKTEDKTATNSLEKIVFPKSLQDKNKTEAAISQKNSPKTVTTAKFSRRFNNPDLSTCWLNSCLQLILSGFDHSSEELHFDSELGLSLNDLVNVEPSRSLDPTDIKTMIIYAEDMRIAEMKSELTDKIKDKEELRRRINTVEDTYLNLRTGQQCVRDFFICLRENMENWIDVYKMFDFTTVSLTICMTCGHTNEFEQSQIHLELDVPPEGSYLSDHVEQALNGGTIVEYRCEDGCQTKFQAEKRSVIKSNRDVQFIIVMLRRNILNPEFELRPEVVNNNVHSDGIIDIR